MVHLKSFLVVLTLISTFWMVSISISKSQPPYIVSGTVSGLNQNSGNILQLSDGSEIPPIGVSGVFSYTSSASTYNVTVVSSPPGMTCSVANGSGQLTGNVTNVWVSCQPANFSPPPSR